LAKGFNNQQIIVAIERRYGLKWTIHKVNVVKTLLHKMWRCEMAHSMNDQIAREVATIDTQIKEAWEAWEFSKKGIKRKKTRTENSNSPAPEMKYDVTEIINEEDTTAGDVKFLQHINDLGKEKRKLLGLYAPEKKNDSDPRTAIQFNIVGDGAGGEITNLMENIIKGAPKQQIKPQDAVEEAQVVTDDDNESDNMSGVNIDSMIDELFNE